MNKRLKKNIEQFLLTYHKDQKDKGGHPYIGHLERVAEFASKIAAYENKDEDFILEVTLLGFCHDLLEDTDCTIEDIYSFIEKETEPTFYMKNGGFSKDLLLLTHNKKEDYFSYVSKLSDSEHASMVKMADLEDNSNLRRLKEIKEEDLKRVDKYHKCMDIIQDKWAFKKITIQRLTD